MGAGVPRPVRPKSQTQRASATAKPRMDGIAANECQRAGPAFDVEAENGREQPEPQSQEGPTSKESIVVGQWVMVMGELVCVDAVGMGAPVEGKYVAEGGGSREARAVRDGIVGCERRRLERRLAVSCTDPRAHTQRRVRLPI